MKDGDFVPLTSIDVITRVDVDEEPGKTHDARHLFSFLMRVVTMNLYSFTRQSANKSKLYTDITKKVHRHDGRRFRDLGTKFWISLVTGLSDLRAPSKRAHNAYTSDKHYDYFAYNEYAYNEYLLYECPLAKINLDLTYLC